MKERRHPPLLRFSRSPPQLTSATIVQFDGCFLRRPLQRSNTDAVAAGSGAAIGAGHAQLGAAQLPSATAVV